MNIEWIITCRFVEVHDNLATIVGGGIDTFWLPALPAPLQVLLAVRVLSTPEELEAAEEVALRSRVFDPAGTTLADDEGKLTIAGTPVRPDWLVGSTLPMIIQFEVADEGTHTIEISVGSASHSVPIHIVEGAP